MFVLLSKLLEIVRIRKENLEWLALNDFYFMLDCKSHWC